ncbi:ATP-dependent RecD-like DNA helicase [Desemzia sp. FAM 24101]|uniref:SF1B family DNA helicase RecD2 n=1 Tax=unclassified Desemzia TaxID=2685243 RepID=UPI0038896805
MDFQEELFDATTEPYIVGGVKAIFFQNPSNFYKVLLIQITETNSDYKEQEVVITGNFGQIQEEEVYRFYGKLVDHPKFGVQFTSSRYHQEKPTSAEGVIAYLSSDKFPGIGEKTAEAIVDALGEEAIDRINADPNVLEQITQLNQKKRDTIVEVIQQNNGMEKIIIGLNQFGFGSQLAYSIYQTYQEQTLEVIQENPYRLLEEVEHVGFKKADAIAEQLGFKADSPMRIKAAIMFSLNELCMSNGDTYTNAENLLTKTIEVLESSRSFLIEPESVADEVLHLIEENKLIEDEGKLYIRSLFAAEWGIATSIERLLESKSKINYTQDIEKEIAIVEKTFAIQYGNSQKEAIKKAVQSPVFILTGGPGTGKTTVLNGIVTLYAELNGLSLDVNDYTEEKPFPILLAAPTGRAAKKMNEATGLPSSTIHRLLGLNGTENPDSEQSEKELDGGLLIVDEMSMVDTWLANQLLRAVPNHMQVLFVGDKDQLPSVGPGQVLHDLLASQKVPSMELNEIYRQGDGSSIITLAHNIKNGELPNDFQKPQRDRSFFNCSAFQIEEVIRQVVSKAKLKGFTAQDIQVLAPMYRGPAGIDALNKMLQEIFNPNDTGRRKEVTFNNKVYRIGDKVLQLVNYPEMNVFNGDMGEIVGISYAKETEDKVDELILRFDANEVTYKRNEWNKITLAYCCSIHKSQGSEFKMVILPMVRNYHRMLRRDLLYTAITRASELLILCGEIPAFHESVMKSSANRLTTLKERITGESGEEQATTEAPKVENAADTSESSKQVAPTSSEETQAVTVETKASKVVLDYRLTAANMKEIDPMIGMEGISPYQM